MNELIKITKQELNGEVIETSDARELHEKLKSKQKFSDWARNKIKQCHFQEGKDYFIILGNRIDGRGGKPRIEYSLTTNSAEHIALMEGNEEGFRVRQYYIDHRRESEKVIRGLVAELQCKNKFLSEDVNTEKRLRSRAVRQANTWMSTARKLIIETKIKESELKLDSPNKDGNPFNRVIPTYPKHDPRLEGKVKKLSDNQPFLPSLSFQARGG